MVGEPAQQAHDLVGRLGVEARHRLVGEQHLRPLGQRAGDRDALRLAARQGAGALPGERRQPDLVEIAVGGVELRGRQAAERGPQPAMAAERAATRHWRGRCAAAPDWPAARSSPAAAAPGAAARPPARRGWCRRARPRRRSGASMRVTQRSSVVLPLPLPPSTTTSSPGVDRQVEPGERDLAVGIAHRQVAHPQHGASPAARCGQLSFSRSMLSVFTRSRMPS